MSADELRKIIREAGIAGMGGAAFPTHVKLSPPPEKKIDYVLINGAECEPYLTADHRAMLERTEDLLRGVRLVMKILGAKKAVIGIEDNKPDAVEAVKKAAGAESGIEVRALHTKYPQGAEKQLIKVITGREVPSGGLPADVGCVVQNVGTCIAIADAVQKGVPLLERIVTITGSAIKEPQNMLVRIGTPVADLIEQCGGFTSNLRKLIIGGPMMGIAQPGADNLPVIKGTSGILCLADSEVAEDEIGPHPLCAVLKSAR